MNKEELIQDYIVNRLSDAENAKVEALLTTDSEMQELYETHQEMATAFQLSNDRALKKELQALDATISSNEETEKKGNRNLTIFRRIAIAAIFIVGVFVVMNQFSGNESLFENYFEICPNTYLPVTRGTSTQEATFEAFKAYESNDFAQAETAFKTILDSEENHNIRFYYAMSLLNQEKTDLALNELNKLTSQTFDYQAEALWYTALIYLKNKNTEAAKNHLQKLQQVNPDYKSEAIQNILSQLP
ncbi:tetratricopeptide repeat protein [Kordia sp. TARA_039_SRF]|nr:tetratricopeptide repeat protein [Kordia sp. TARA_039_SRF]